MRAPSACTASSRGKASTARGTEPGYRDYFGFVAGAGTRVRVTLDRTDLTLPPGHLDAPAPELLLLRPDGMCSAASEPLGLEATGTSVETALSMSGAQVIVARTPKGSGQYRVHLDLPEEGGTGKSVLGSVSSPVQLVTLPRGAGCCRAAARPVRGAAVGPAGGVAAVGPVRGGGGPLPDRGPGLQPSSRNGYAWLDQAVDDGVDRRQVVASLPEEAPGKRAGLDRSASLARAAEALSESRCSGTPPSRRRPRTGRPAGHRHRQGDQGAGGVRGRVRRQERRRGGPTATAASS